MRSRGMAVGPVWLPIAAGFPAVFINLDTARTAFSPPDYSAPPCSRCRPGDPVRRAVRASRLQAAVGAGDADRACRRGPVAHRHCRRRHGDGAGRPHRPAVRRRSLACLHRLHRDVAQAAARAGRRRLRETAKRVRGGAHDGRRRCAGLRGSGSGVGHSRWCGTAWAWRSACDFDLKADASRGRDLAGFAATCSTTTS